MNTIIINRFSTTIIQKLTFLFLLCALFFSFQHAFYIRTEKLDSILLIIYILGTLIFIIFFSLFMNRLITEKVFILMVAIVAITVRMYWVLNINTPIESDFALLYNAAIDAARGDFSFSKTPYFTAWVYQIGFTMYQALIISIFGENILILKLLNVIFSTGIVVVVFFIGSVLFGETAARAASILYAIYIPSIVMTSVLSNDHLSTFLYLLAFYLIVKSQANSTKVGLTIGLLIALGNIIRPIGSIILITVFLYYMVYHVIRVNKEKMLVGLKTLVGIIATYFLIMSIASHVFIAAGVTEYPLSNRAPYWKFLLGFNHETKGQYSIDDIALVAPYQLGEERNKLEKALIKERLSDKTKVAKLFYDKTKIMWGRRDSSVFWSMSNINRPYIYSRIRIFEQAVYLIMLFFAAVLALFYKNSSKYNENALFFMILILGYFFVHLLIEIQTRYRFFIIPTFSILSGGGLSYIHERIQPMNLGNVLKCLYKGKQGQGVKRW